MLKVTPSRSPVRRRRRDPNAPDLHTQYESLLDQVWRCEADWRFYDRIDAFCASEPDHCQAAADQGSKR
jgi:hypothetical protein